MRDSQASRRFAWAALTLRILTYGLLVHAEHSQSQHDVARTSPNRDFAIFNVTSLTCRLDDFRALEQLVSSSEALEVTLDPALTAEVPLTTACPANATSESSYRPTSTASASEAAVYTLNDVPPISTTSSSVTDALPSPTISSLPIIQPVENLDLEQIADTEEVHIPEFPSFEDWKQKHLAQAVAAGNGHIAKDHNRKAGHDKAGRNEDYNDAPPIGAEIDMPVNDPAGNDQAPVKDFSGPEASLTPALQRNVHPVPNAGSGVADLDPLETLRDRTNYASADCSAALTRASKLTKSASAILNNKKDRYMLSPCASKEKYVIIELCDEIQIDTLVLANFEFFSSMFKQFRVRAGTAYPESAGTWQDLGLYRATNSRGLQVFKVPDANAGGFNRYIRIDFMTHYGNEYYCPVSVLRVYGFTQLDAFRRDQALQAKLAEAFDIEQADDLDDAASQDYVVVPSAVVITGYDLKPSRPTGTDEPVTKDLTHTTQAVEPSASTDISVTSASNSPTDAPSFTQMTASTPTQFEQADLPSTAERTSTVDSRPLAQPATSGTHVAANMTAANDARLTSSAVEAHSLLEEQSSASIPTSAVNLTAQTPSATGATAREPVSRATSTHAASSHDPARPSNVGAARQSDLTVSVSSVINTKVATTVVPGPSVYRRNDTARHHHQPAPQVVYTHAHATHSHANDTIYGTIMKRLTALEVNMTLSTAYLDEHTRLVWATFRKIEDRLAGIERSVRLPSTVCDH